MPLNIEITDVLITAIVVQYSRGTKDINFTIEGFQVDSDGNKYQSFQFYEILDEDNAGKIRDIAKVIAEAYKESVGI